MQADTGLLQLPKRPRQRVGSVAKIQKKIVLTNFYDIDVSGKDSSIYQFVVDTEPEIPSDSKEIIFQLNRSLKRQFKEKIGLSAASGKILWGIKNLKVPLSIKTEFMFKETQYKFDVIVKPTKTLPIADLLKTDDGRKMVFQVMNNRIKGVLREQRMDELTRGKYFNNKEVQVHQAGLNVLRGFKFTLCALKSGLSLQIDVCSRVFRAKNLLQEMQALSKDQQLELVGSTVLTNYGRRRTYVILSIDYSMNPGSSFYSDKKQGKITFAEYFDQSYGLKVSNKKQPLIEVITRVEKVRNKQGALEKVEHKGYLLPEFVSLTGMSDEQRKNYQTMQKIAPFTKLHPSERMQSNSDIINTLNKSGEVSIGKARELTAYQLLQPRVRLKNNDFPSRDGSLNFKDQPLKAVKVSNWAIVYSQGKQPKYDNNQVDDFFGLLLSASKAFGITFEQPGYVACGTNINSWKKQIQTDCQNNGKPQIIVLFFQPFEEKFYGQLKRYITCDLKVPCQAIRRRTVSKKSKNPMSAASKIILQMNQKIGGTIWEVYKEAKEFNTKMMYGAFSISKGKRGFTLAFVGTLDNQNTKIYAYCKTGYKRKEDIPRQDFETIFLNWAKNYVKNNQDAPKMILVYRQGLSIPQIQLQCSSEVQALKEVVKIIGEKTKKQNYKPEVIFVTVNKKINTRIFESTNSGQSQGKFPPKASNPSSGTCMFEQASMENLYDFHITAQKVTQGTCTPTQYIVAHDDSSIAQESLAQFTYEQCFNYYNWQGAVKVPACMQCADKLAKLVGQHIQANVTQGDILKSYFFL